MRIAQFSQPESWRSLEKEREKQTEGKAKIHQINSWAPSQDDLAAPAPISHEQHRHKSRADD